MSGPTAEKGLRACVRSTVLREVITKAIADAERVGMTGRTRDEWVSIAILGSSRIPLEPHFPPEGGGPCPVCQTYVIPPGRSCSNEYCQGGRVNSTPQDAQHPAIQSDTECPVCGGSGELP